MTPKNSNQWEKYFRSGIFTLFYREYPLMELRDDASQSVIEFLLKILRFLLRQYPQRAELEQWLYIHYPSAQYALNRNQRKRIFPVDQLQNLISKEFGNHHEMDVSYLATTLEHCTKDLFKLVNDYVHRLNKTEIVANDVELVINADAVFLEISSRSDSSVHRPISPIDSSLNSLSYDELVRHFILLETQYKDDLELLIKLFRNPFQNFSSNVDLIFGCLDEIFDLTSRFLSDLADAKEMRDEILLDESFQNFLEGNEYECYVKYAETIGDVRHDEYFHELFNNDQLLDYFQKRDDQMFETARYLLPALLHLPIHHYDDYLIYLEKFVSFGKTNSFVLNDVLSVLRQKHFLIKRVKSPLYPQLSIHSLNMSKTSNWKQQIENWDLKESNSLFDGSVKHLISSNGYSTVDRRAILFSSVLCLCKSISNEKWKIKEKISLKKFNVNDRPTISSKIVVSTEFDIENLFEIRTDDRHILLVASNSAEKSQWLTFLFYIRNKNVLQRDFYNLLIDEDSQQILLTPDPQIYKFAEADCPTNILIDYPSNDKSFLIRGATIEKLIEYLTHHQFLHPRFVKYFLMTYKSYCSPAQLLSLLIERFQIPEPNSTFQTEQQLKKFRKEYVQPVQLRVLNVLRQWVDKYFNDLVESNEQLLEQIKTFLRSIGDTGGFYPIKTSIFKLIEKQTIDYRDPSRKRHGQDLVTNEKDQIEDLDVFHYDLKELSDQITLISSTYFRSITTQELLYRLPNLYNLQNYMKFLDKVLGFWCKRSIYETSNFDERVAVAERFVQIAIRAYEKKNFAGVFALIFGGIIDLDKALPHTWERLSKQSRTFVTLVDDMLGEDSHFKLYFEKLRQSPLPVVPFIANNQTRIAQMKEKHNFIVLSTGETLINFRKFQQIGEHLSEIQQYQNMPYDIPVNIELQKQLKRLNPMKNFVDENSFQNYLVTLKEQIEPAESSPRSFPSRRPVHSWRTHSRVSRLFLLPSSSRSDEIRHRSTSKERKLKSDQSFDSFAFENSLCNSTDDLQVNLTPPPIPPRLRRSATSE